MDFGISLAERFHIDPFRFLDMPGDQLMSFFMAVIEFDERKAKRNES